MFRYVVVSLFFAAVNAGLLGAPALAPVAYSAPVVAAPLAVKTAVPIATSYQNTYKVSAPIAAVAAAPVFKAAPLITAPVATPLVSSVVAAPVLKAAPLISSPLALGHIGLH